MRLPKPSSRVPFAPTASLRISRISASMLWPRRAARCLRRFLMFSSSLRTTTWAIAHLISFFANMISPGNWSIKRSPHRRRDIAAVDGGDVGGGLERQRLVQEASRHVVGGDFDAE